MGEIRINYGCYFCRVSQLLIKKENEMLADLLISPKYNVSEMHKHFTHMYKYPINKVVDWEEDYIMRKEFFKNLPSFSDQHKTCDLYSVIIFKGDFEVSYPGHDQVNKPPFSCKFFLIEGDPLLFSSLYLWRYHSSDNVNEYENYLICTKKYPFPQKSNSTYNEFSLERKGQAKTLFETEDNNLLIQLKFGTIMFDYTVLYLSGRSKNEKELSDIGQYRYISAIDDDYSIAWF